VPSTVVVCAAGHDALEERLPIAKGDGRSLSSSQRDLEIRFVLRAVLYGAASPMGNRPRKGRKQRIVNRPDIAPEAPYRDPSEATKPVDLSLTENLLRSHAELCAALRLAGRQILRLKGDQESLNRIRQALKNAETLRSMWKNPERTEAVIPASPAETGTEPVATEASQAANPDRKRPGRLTRPHPHRVLRFPSGDGSR
jgi:hypothetical protein